MDRGRLLLSNNRGVEGGYQRKDLFWWTMKVWTVLTLLFVVAGCTKKTDVFVFDCVVFDQKNNTAVSQANIVMKVQYAAGGFNPNYETVGTTTTDANGRFYLEIEKDVYYSFRVEVNDPHYFSSSFNINPDQVPFSTAYSTTFNVEPKAWVRTHLLNQNMSQAATFSVDAETDECAECCASGNTIIQGFPVDSIFVCQVYGEQQVNITGNYLDENGAVHQIAQTAFAASFDTTTVTVVY
jgi:hypothetical protein